VKGEAEFADEFGEIFLGFVGYVFEVHRDTGGFVRGGVTGERSGEALAGGGIGEHLRHGFDLPVAAVVVVDERHLRQIGVDGFEEGVELGIVIDGERAVGSGGVKLFRNEQVDIVVMLFERGEAVGVPVDVKAGAERVVRFRNVADGSDFAKARGAEGNALGFRGSAMRSGIGNRTVERAARREQKFWKIGAAENVDEKSDDQEREENAADFEDAASASPATALFIVENGLAFHHRDNPS